MKIFFVINGSLYKDQENNYFANTIDDIYLSRYVRISSKLIIGANLLPKTQYTGKNKISNTVLSKTTIIELPKLSSLKGLFFNMTEFKNIIERLVFESDAVVIRYPMLFGIHVIRAAKRHNKPYLIELVGCPWDALWNHSFKGKILAPFQYYKTKTLIKNATHVLYVTNQFLQQRYPTKGKSTNCSNVALTEFDDSVLEKRLDNIRLKDDSEKIIIGTTAAVDVRYKGQQYVIKALGKLKRQGITNYEYQLVGGGDQAYLKSVAEKEGVTDQVKFLGSIPHEKVFEWLETIDIYAQPSQTEGLPRALVEAMSKGIPSIGTNAGGITELLDEEVIFKKGKTMVSAIVRVLKSFNKDTMLYQAKRNFGEAKKYDKDIIDERRRRFYEGFKSTLRK